MLDNAAQTQKWYILIYLFFLVKIVVGIFITRNWWLDVVASIKILAIKLVNDPLDLFPYYHDLHIAYR